VAENRLPGPSENRALDFKGKYRRFEKPSVPTTIANDWSIFLARRAQPYLGLYPKKTVSTLARYARLRKRDGGDDLAAYRSETTHTKIVWTAVSLGSSDFRTIVSN